MKTRKMGRCRFVLFVSFFFTLGVLEDIREQRPSRFQALQSRQPKKSIKSKQTIIYTTIRLISNKYFKIGKCE